MKNYPENCGDARNAADVLPASIITLHEAVALESGDAERHFNLGEAYLNLHKERLASGFVSQPFRLSFTWGELPYPVYERYPLDHRESGLSALRDCLAIEPNHSGAQIALGLQLALDGKLAEAGEMLQATVLAAPENAGSHLGMAMLAARAGERSVAERAVQASLALQNNSLAAALADGLGALAGEHIVLRGRIADDIAVAQALIGLAEKEVTGALSLADAYAEAALAAAVEGKFVKSFGYLFGANQLAPCHAPIAAVAGLVLLCDGHLQSARIVTAHSVEMAKASDIDGINSLEAWLIARLYKPPADYMNLLSEAHSTAWLPLGERLLTEMDFNGAAEVFKKVIKSAPDDVLAWRQLARAHYHQARLTDALAAAQRAEALAPHSSVVAVELAVCLLANGRAKEAWPLYEARLKLHRANARAPSLALPRWTGDAGPNHTLLVWREEGIGDEVRFAALLPDLLKLWRGRIIFVASERLLALYRRAMPSINFIPSKAIDIAAAASDAHVPVASLPMYLGYNAEQMQDRPALLAADPKRVNYWRARLMAIGDGPKVGFNWRSLNSSWEKRALNLKLDDLRPLLALEGIVPVNLQVGATQREIEDLHVFDNLDLHNDLDETVALIAALDAVVSSRCWVATFAGAAGTPAYCPTRHPNPFMFGGPVFPSFPSVKMYYDDTGESWCKPVNAIARVLESSNSTKKNLADEHNN